MHAVRSFISGRRTSWIVLVGCLVAIGAVFALVPQPDSSSVPQSGLPASAQSAKVSAALKSFPSADTAIAIVVWTRADGRAFASADLAAIANRVPVLAKASTTPEAVRLTVAQGSTSAYATVLVSAASVTSDPERAADRLRAIASHDLPSDVRARLTGQLGFEADVVNSFAGADLRLLLVTGGVVALLLLITYRSPVLWIVPLVVIASADGVARVVANAVASAVGIQLDASVSGILSVLVFGAGTDYALLLVARYREELRRTPDRHAAMAAALRGAGPAILASGGTVTLALLTLLLASLAGNRALGLACAVGIVLALLFATIMLPAALVVFGRGLFWPFVPRAETAEHLAAGRPGVWERVGRGVQRRPVVVAVAAIAGVSILALGLFGARIGLSQTEQLVGTPESVAAQKILEADFGPQVDNIAIVLIPDASASSTSAGSPRSIASGVAHVASVTVGSAHAGRTELLVAIDAAPQSDSAYAAIRTLRSRLDAAGGATATSLVGGSDATALDTLDAAQHDQDLILPIILALVFVLLALLLRSLVAPALLLATVLATFFASLGASNLLFQRVLGFPAFNSTTVLFAFLFLVALGVDYNIFLTTRAREERMLHGTREGMVRALASTGAVITSAGILLAAVFAVLGVLPVVALTQIGVIVCIGVLLDTLVVRTLLVPALVFLTGDRFWWPGRRAAG